MNKNATAMSTALALLIGGGGGMMLGPPDFAKDADPPIYDRDMIDDEPPLYALIANGAQSINLAPIDAQQLKANFIEWSAVKDADLESFRCNFSEADKLSCKIGFKGGEVDVVDLGKTEREDITEFASRVFRGTLMVSASMIRCTFSSTDDSCKVDGAKAVPVDEIPNKSVFLGYVKVESAAPSEG